MAEILKEWLSERLQRPFKWEAEEFGTIMKNGYVISSILLSYHVINEEKHFLIRSSNAEEDINSNWRYICEWLRELDIHLTDSDLNSVKDGKGSMLLRLFYQLFLCLDKRDRINYIKRERKMTSNLVEKLEHRFKVDKVKEEEASEIDELSKPLLNEKYFIEWQRAKEAQVKDTYDFMRHKYLKTCERIQESQITIKFQPPKSEKLTSREKLDMEKFSKKYPCKFHNYSYDELINLEQEVTEKKVPVVDTDWVRNYMGGLKNKMHCKSESEKFQKHISNMISTSLWDMSVAEEESKFNIDLAKKVMKLSQFEKQMCTQILETKQQARNVMHNRITIVKEFSDQRDHQFNQYLDNVKEQIHLEAVEIDFEKNRQNMLHTRLYAEKMKRKRQHYYEICYDTMLSIVDYATKYAYFKLLIGDDIPEHFIREWKTLYYKNQPIFDILNQIEDILQEHGVEEEVSSDIELIITEELDRQDCVNDSDFKDYLNYSGLWKLEALLPNFEAESEDRKWEYLGSRILGHVVFTLLGIKYAYPPGSNPAALPDFSSKVLLRALPDRSITVPIQALLNHRKIHVVRLETAINYCLNMYKVEMIGCQDIEIPFEKFITMAPEDCKEFIRLIKAEENKTETANFVTPVNAKQTQTPKTIPEEEIVLSTSAELGKYAFDCLCSGDALTDHLISAMLVEYIKSQEGIKGFVIINYPNSYRETQILEETFSGRSPPDEVDLDDRDEIYLEESIQKHRKKEKDPYKDIRLSRLVQDPHKKAEELPFRSYFTCYIKLKETEDILQENVIWYLSEDNSELIDRFYACLGLNYSMYYEFMEKEFLAQMCKYIIGDFDLPLKSDDNLFGESVLSLLDFPTTDDKRQKSRIVKPDSSIIKSKDRLRKGSKVSKHHLKHTSVIKEESNLPELVGSIILLQEVEDDNKSKSVILEEIKILAGEEDWIYGEFPIAESIGVAMASMWELVEKHYIHDLEQLFFAKRLQMSCLVPYACFLKDKMEQIISLPSNKQDVVVQFQTQYNAFEDDWRNTNVSKNEWHCRIKKFQNTLYHICDERKLHAERQRQALIIDNWAMEELTSMVNTYISCMQTELNRSVLTYQILHDFYLTLLKHIPSSDRLSSKDLIKITRESDESISNKKGGNEDKVYRQLKSTYIDMQLKHVAIDFSNNPFNPIVENNVKFVYKTAKDMNDSYRSLINKEQAEISKVSVPTKGKKDDQMGSRESIPKEEVYKMNAMKCIEEWLTGINGEMCRLNLRMAALQNRCYRDMKLFNDYIYKTFDDIQQHINNYYMNEIKSVDRLCKYFQMAVENGRKIEETLILENDNFIIDPNLLQYAPSEPTVDGTLDEVVTDKQFKIGQLARLRSQFKIVAPNGISLQKPFIYILQDFIFYGKETIGGALFPKMWKSFNPDDVPKLVYALFGEAVYVDWRDFLIYCMNITFPTVEELLHLRNIFRCEDLESTELIKRDFFLNQELWFENDFDLENNHLKLRLTLIKHFLFELFEVSQDLMNYSAFLLALSKHNNPIIGFTTALSMAVGKKTCYILDECNAVIQKLIKLKQYRDACKECAQKCAEQFLDKLLTNVINHCVSTVISEIEFVEAPPDKKAKKGKSGNNNKGGSQSARLPKSSGISKSKLAQSATDIKTTFICKPCEEEPVIEPKIEEIPETPKSLPLELEPDLAYSISKNDLWNVLKICMPWPFQYMPEQKISPYVHQINEVILKLEKDTDDGSIYISKFVQEPSVCKLLHKIKKFCAFDITEEVKKYLHT